MKPLYIFDIDGTLANQKHRQHHLDAKEYDTYYSLVGKDDTIMPVIRTCQRLILGGADVWFFSGRRETCRADTADWVRKHVRAAMEDEHLVMRPYNDFRDDVEVKQDMIDNMLDIDRGRLVAVFDDRQRVVDMWRRNGITCYQVAPGNF